MYSKAIFGGTFDVIHQGHRDLAQAAFTVAKTVVVGITSDDFANKFRAAKTEKLGVREENLDEFLKTFDKPFEVTVINDSYGPATVDPGVDCLVVSEETLLRAEEINAIRYKKGIPKLTIVVVPITPAEDGGPISSVRIRKGEIDAQGKVLRKA